MHIRWVTVLIGIALFVTACQPISAELVRQDRSVALAATPTAQPMAAIQSSPTPPPTPAPVDPQLVEAGKKAYLRNYCGSCHTLTAAGARGVFAPAHDHVATVALQHIADPRYAGKATTSAEYLRESLLDPNIYLAPGATGSRTAMPAFSHLAQDELESIVYFLLQQK